MTDRGSISIFVLGVLMIISVLGVQSRYWVDKKIIQAKEIRKEGEFLSHCADLMAFEAKNQFQKEIFSDSIVSCERAFQNMDSFLLTCSHLDSPRTAKSLWKRKGGQSWRAAWWTDQ